MKTAAQQASCLDAFQQHRHVDSDFTASGIVVGIHRIELLRSWGAHNLKRNQTDRHVGRHGLNTCGLNDLVKLVDPILAMFRSLCTEHLGLGLRPRLWLWVMKGTKMLQMPCLPGKKRLA